MYTFPRVGYKLFKLCHLKSVTMHFYEIQGMSHFLVPPYNTWPQTGEIDDSTQTGEINDSTQTGEINDSTQTGEINDSTQTG